MYSDTQSKKPSGILEVEWECKMNATLANDARAGVEKEEEEEEEEEKRMRILGARGWTA